MYIKIKGTNETVSLDSPRGKEELEKQTAAAKAKLAAEEEAREKVRLEKLSIKIAEAEATLRDAAEDAGVSLEEYLGFKKPRAPRKPKA